MFEHSLISHLAQVRDAGASTSDSWKTRYRSKGDSELRNFEISAVHPLGDETADDIIWCLFAAAQLKSVTHLKMYVHWSTAQESIRSVFDRITRAVYLYRFDPLDFDLCIEDEANGYIRISLFSKEELERIR